MIKMSESDELSFSDLPIELQSKIFSYLDQHTLSKSVVTVCKSWRNHAYDPLWWTKLLVPSSVGRGQLFILLSRVNLLKNLTLRASECMPVLAGNSSHLPLLEKLDLGFCDPCCENDFCTILKNCPLINMLNVEGCAGFNDNCVAELVKLTCLTSLNVAHCKFITNAGIVNIATTCKRLEDLCVEGITLITDAAIITLCENLKMTISKLRLDGEELTELSLKRLRCCKNLDLLAIPYSEGLTDNVLVYIRSLNNLKWLQIHKANHVTSLGLANFFSSTNFKDLLYLDMESPMLDDRAITNITENCPLLMNLLLCWCWEVTEEGLSKIVNKCRWLKYLDLTGLFSITGHSLIDIPTKLPNLMFLNLQQCNNVVDDILPKIVRATNNLMILNYYGEIVSDTESEEYASSDNDCK
ncbi:Uncharacterised protein r2_g4257 [Pycnogonum litorale]